MKMQFGQVSCSVTAAEKMHFSSDVPCELEMDTIRYAACRFLTKSRKLQQKYVRESYQHRIASKRKDKKPRYETCMVPAAAMELPGSWAVMRVKITAEGVTIQSLKLSDTFPGTVRFSGKEDRSDGKQKSNRPGITCWRDGRFILA